MKHFTLLLLALLTALTFNPNVRADDLEGETTAEPVDWEPVITAFYLRPRLQDVSPTALKLDKKESLPGLRAAWLELKPKVATPTGAIPDGQGVVSGWKLDKDSSSSESISAYLDITSNDKGILTMLKDEGAQLVVGLDVIMSMDPSRKQQILDNYFKIIEMEVTKGVEVSADPKKFRDAVPADAKPKGLMVSINKQTNPFGADWNAAGGKLITSEELINRAPGVMEFRFRATISGKFSSFEKEQIKTVEGAFRVAFVGQALEIRKISFDEKKVEAKKPAKKP